MPFNMWTPAQKFEFTLGKANMSWGFQLLKY